MKNNILKTATFIAAITVIYSCNKSKMYINRLDDGDWNITELSVDGTNEAELPHWKINECNAYKEACIGEWKNSKEHTAKFAWQFRDRGKYFEISNQSTLEEATNGLTGNDFFAAKKNLEQCQNFTGVYEVVEHKKKSMEFKSTAAIGFSGKTVLIKIEKK